MAATPTFTNNRINDAISAQQRFQSKINSAGTKSMADIAAEVATNLKGNAA